MTTPRHPWPMGTAPTAAQLLEWLREGPMHDEDDALRYLDAILRDARAGHRCIIAEHDRGMQELNRLRVDATRWAILRDHYRTLTPPQHDSDLIDRAIELLEQDDTP